MKLYHGSLTPSVEQPDLSQCYPATDFGKGFYATTSFEQAKKWALLKQKRLQATDAYVSEYEMDDRVLRSDKYIIRVFTGAADDWLQFVTDNRKGRQSEFYDLVMGPVANDSLYATLLLYEQEVLSAATAIEQLKTHKLFDQLSFHSDKAVQTLRFIKSIVI
ncbi:MAG: DUF3990 domain-containing protein [Dysgonamonadaceae bacterium]|jgi:hypothetical protein|nr:DUF3990 domain-containing protein [Dysgonamonadaceae bacterium]